MEGATVDLDSCGGHTHTTYPYHYHAHTLTGQSTNSLSGTNGNGPFSYTAYLIAPTSCWKGDVGAVSNFWASSQANYDRSKNDQLSSWSDLEQLRPCCSSASFYAASGISISGAVGDGSVVVVGGCSVTLNGCCSDGETGKVDANGSNCPTEATTEAAAVTTINPSGQMTCAQLGWTTIVNNVCGESDAGMGGCQAASLADARTICSNAGARLCTTEEVDAGSTAATGCNFDSGYTWTDTWCGLGPEGGKFYIAMGGGNDRAWKCKNPKKSYNVRCCSDVNLAATTVVAATTTTTFPFLSERKTCAELDWPVVGNACGESDKAFKNGEDTCFTWKNHPDAERKCLKLGGRMCSQADIEAGVGKATGCQFDRAFVWTSTSCGTNMYIQAKGNGDGSTQCAESKSKGPMRCCSDVTIFSRTSETAGKSGKMPSAFTTAQLSATTGGENGRLIAVVAALGFVAIVGLLAGVKQLVHMAVYTPIPSDEPSTPNRFR